MITMTLSLLASLVLLSWMMVVAVDGAGPVNSAAIHMYKTSFNGDATYYGDSNGGGTCSYGIQNPPVASQAKYSVALNRPQFLNSVMCGSCWTVTGSGHGAGNNPVTGTFMVFANDLCPECHAGDVDLSVNGDGRWDVSIQAVQCPVGNGKLAYKFQGSNPYYLKLQVRNARIPVHKMEIDHNGWHSMTHSADGFFIFTSGPVHGSFRIRLTAINGAQVIDTVSGIHNDVIIHGHKQFPLDSTLPH